MPIHDWSRVDAEIFHHFHHCWTTEIQRSLNRGVLPPGYYALAEQITSGLGPDVVTLGRPIKDREPQPDDASALMLLNTPPQVEMRQRSEAQQYAAKTKAIVIRHKSDDVVVAVIEIISPGNKNSRHGLRSFVAKAVELIEAGVHLLLIDLFAPGPRDPQGIHKAIWDEFNDNEFVLPPARRLTLVSYLACPAPEAFIQPMAVGQPLKEMPLFLTLEEYVSLPLEPSYMAAWADVPGVWQTVIEGQ